MATVRRDEQVHQASNGSLNGGRRTNVYTATTSDATPKVMAQIPVAVLEALTVTVTVVGKKADATAACHVSQWAGFRRASGGNVTLVGALQGTTIEDSAGTPAIALSANTTAQTVDLTVTGIAAEAWGWEANVVYTKI